MVYERSIVAKKEKSSRIETQRTDERARVLCDMEKSPKKMNTKKINSMLQNK